MSKINTDCKYIPPDLCEIPEGTRIRSLSTNMDRRFLDNLRKTAVCPDDISLVTGFGETFRQTWHQ